MPAFKLGIVMPLMQFGPDRSTARWAEIRAMALRAEAIGFATIWTPDELLWRAKDAAPHPISRVCGGGSGPGVDRPVHRHVREPVPDGGARPNVVSGTPGEIAATLLTFRDAGYTQAELMFDPGTMEALEALAPWSTRRRLRNALAIGAGDVVARSDGSGYLV